MGETEANALQENSEQGMMIRGRLWSWRRKLFILPLTFIWTSVYLLKQSRDATQVLTEI